MSADAPELLRDKVWQQALEKYAIVTHLSVVLYDTNAHAVGGTVSMNTFHALFQEHGYEPGAFNLCARRCLTQGASGTVIEQSYGLGVVGAPLALDSRIVGAAVAGYALVEFCQSSAIDVLARQAGVPFRRLWTVAQQARPLSQHRLALHGDLLQVLGNTVLQQVARTQQLQELAADLERRVGDRTHELAASNESLEHELREREAAERRVRELLARLVVVQEGERNRIARDVHDNLGQQMVALKLKLEILQTKPETSGWRTELQQLYNQVLHLDQDLVSFTRELRPALLDEFGLLEALRSFVGDWGRAHGVSADFHDVGVDGLQLSQDVEINLFRVAQEALNNVYKHAHATHVDVGLQARDRRVVLTIEDDGVGFDSGAIHQQDPNAAGAGLANMRERVWLLRGHLEIEKAVAGGTSVIVTIPMDAALSPSEHQADQESPDS